MSVLDCSRAGCKEIMCSRLSDKYGYICNECFAELNEVPEEVRDIREFMNTPRHIPDDADLHKVFLNIRDT